MKNTLTVTRGEGRGIVRERTGRGKSRNMNRRLVGTDNRVGIGGGDWLWGRGGTEESDREKGGTTVIEQQ